MGPGRSCGQCGGRGTQGSSASAESPGSSQGWAWVPPKRPPQPPPASRTHALGTGYLRGALAEAPAPCLCRVKSHRGPQVRLISLHLWTRVSPTAQTRPPLPDTHLWAWRRLLALSSSSSGRASLSGCRSPTTTVALRLRSSLCFCSASFMASISKEGETTLEASKRRRRSPGPEPLAHERPGGVPSPAASLLPAVAPIPPREPAGWAGLSYFFPLNDRAVLFNHRADNEVELQPLRISPAKGCWQPRPEHAWGSAHSYRAEGKMRKGVLNLRWQVTAWEAQLCSQEEEGSPEGRGGAPGQT